MINKANLYICNAKIESISPEILNIKLLIDLVDDKNLNSNNVRSYTSIWMTGNIISLI
jgi:hypothetical protein